MPDLKYDREYILNQLDEREKIIRKGIAKINYI